MELNRRQKMADEKIIALQKDLIPLIDNLHETGELCFKTVPAKGNGTGDYWMPIDDIKVRYLYTYYSENPEWVISTSQKIADDYQKVIAEYQREKPEEFQNLLENGKKWLFGKLLTWGGSVVEEGLLDQTEIAKLADDFQKIIDKKGEKFFGYAHGNVIGDHIYVDEGKNLYPHTHDSPHINTKLDGHRDAKHDSLQYSGRKSVGVGVYLLGMRIAPRPGRGYYDFLRSLDWFILKADADFEQTVGWMKQYLADLDWEEIKLVFAVRCLGILGWDMLHRGDMGAGDTEKKKQILLKFIRREY